MPRPPGGRPPPANQPPAKLPPADLPIIAVRKVEDPDGIADVRELFVEYLHFVEDFLGESLDFQDTEREFAEFPATYDALFLATRNGHPVGAAGLKAFDATRGELKRLYVREAGRGLGLGQLLITATLAEARLRGYRTLLLDTDPGLHHANRIYERLGFRDVDCYYDNPRQDRSRYMALEL